MVTETDKIDFLWKKVIFGVTKTADENAKFGSNETISSPLPVYQNQIWAEAADIPASAPSSDTAIVEVLTGANAIQMTNDPTSAPNQTWLAATTFGTPSTLQGDFIPPTFSTSYAVKVFVGDPNSSGTRIFPDTSNEEWVFDYNSGTLHFTGNIPSGVSSNGIYIEVFRYIGVKGVVLDKDAVGASRTTVVADIAARDALTDLSTGDLVHVQDASAIATDARAGEHATYLWNGSSFTLVATQDSARSDSLTQQVTLEPRAGETIDLGWVGNGTRIVAVSLEVTVPFDGTMEITLGDGTTTDIIMASNQNDLAEAGIYVSNPNWVSSSTEETLLQATATGTATTGTAIVTFTYA